MLRFALVASGVGLAAALFFIGANEISPVESPVPLWVLFGGVFVAFIPAVMGHPKASHEGTTVRVDPRQTIKSAPLWSTVLLGASMLFVMVLAFLMPDPQFSFASRADLIGRPDRFRMVAALTNVFYAAGLHVALSGLRLERDFLDYLNTP